MELGPGTKIKDEDRSGILWDSSLRYKSEYVL